ncbi:CsbD family protein [Gilvimarinus polysaccharolyticus]|uniref:CsbD family protein n=1 Tax=Gilvimarinus polysaccharolyticus TaxID=863921 RepID=UPI0006736E5F|nr:CsbD family protein [Gilvimarinus polysaccharolyticus]
MNKLELEGNWQKLKGTAREQWGKLTDNDIERVVGKRDKLIGAIKERYSMTQQEAEREVNEWSVKYEQ